MLLEEAVDKGYGGCETGEELRATILEAERCAKVAYQMASVEHRGDGGSSITTRGNASSSALVVQELSNHVKRKTEDIEYLVTK